MDHLNTLADIKGHLAAAGAGLGPAVLVPTHGTARTPIPRGRHLIDIPGVAWHQQVLTCTADKRLWIADGEILVCTGCGLDCT